MPVYFTPEQNKRLRSTDWVTLNLTDAQYLVKSAFDADRYLLLITNLRNVWVEDLEAAHIKRKAKEYQSALEPSDAEQMEKLLGVLSEFFNSQKDGATYKVEAKDDELKLHCSTSLEWATLTWTFTCHEIWHGFSDNDNDFNRTLLDASSVLYIHLTLPLLTMARGYQNQCAALREQLEAKDAEVAEARELLENAGIVDSVRKKRTKPFDDKEADKALQQTVLQTLDDHMSPLHIFNHPGTIPLLRAATEALVPISDATPSFSSHDKDANLSSTTAAHPEGLSGEPEQAEGSATSKRRGRSTSSTLQREEIERREALKEKLEAQKELLGKKKKKKLF